MVLIWIVRRECSSWWLCSRGWLRSAPTEKREREGGRRGERGKREEREREAGEGFVCVQD